MIIKIIAYDTEFDLDIDKPHMEETYYHESLDDLIKGFADFVEDLGLTEEEDYE